MSFNQISRIGDAFAHFPHVTVLYLHANNIASLSQVKALGELKDRFVYCFTWRICTLTLASTQRAEVMQNVAKNTMGMGTKTTLTEMFNKADVYNHDSRHKHDVKAVRTASSQARTAAASLPPLLQDLQPLVSVFAYKLLSSQAQQASKYRYESGEEEGGSHSLDLSPELIAQSADQLSFFVHV